METDSEGNPNRLPPMQTQADFYQELFEKVMHEGLVQPYSDAIEKVALWYGFTVAEERKPRIMAEMAWHNITAEEAARAANALLDDRDFCRGIAYDKSLCGYDFCICR